MDICLADYYNQNAYYYYTDKFRFGIILQASFYWYQYYYYYYYCSRFWECLLVVAIVVAVSKMKWDGQIYPYHESDLSFETSNMVATKCTPNFLLSATP